MTKDLDLVKQFISLVKESSVAELSFENENYKIHINMNNLAMPVANYVPAPTAKAPTVQNITEVQKPEVKSNLYEIKSPFVGTFYASPAPGKPNYVKVGDKVKKGQTLCILEAMKIMNEIECDVDGVIEEICIENESLVEYGEVLFKIGK